MYRLWNLESERTELPSRHQLRSKRSRMRPTLIVTKPRCLRCARKLFPLRLASHDGIRSRSPVRDGEYPCWRTPKAIDRLLCLPRASKATSALGFVHINRVPGEIHSHKWTLKMDPIPLLIIMVVTGVAISAWLMHPFYRRSLVKADLRDRHVRDLVDDEKMLRRNPETETVCQVPIGSFRASEGRASRFISLTTEKIAIATPRSRGRGIRTLAFTVRVKMVRVRFTRSGNSTTSMDTAF